MSSGPPTPTRTPTRARTIPRPPPSPIRPSSPSTASTLSAAAGALSPRRSLTPQAAAASSNGAGTHGSPLADKPKGRARDLLRKHYGLGAGPPPRQGIGAGRPMDPMDLDSPAFDAKSYYDQLITVSSLPALLKRENELMSEIRELDSERQSLVYNHHHELIAASDTIAAMKYRAENLDADLDRLKIAFSEISRLGAEIIGDPPALDLPPAAAVSDVGDGSTEESDSL